MQIWQKLVRPICSKPCLSVFIVLTSTLGTWIVDEVLECCVECLAVDTFTGAGPKGNPDVVDKAFQSLEILWNNHGELGLVTVSFCTTWRARVLIKRDNTHLNQSLILHIRFKICWDGAKLKTLCYFNQFCPWHQTYFFKKRIMWKRSTGWSYL